MFILCKMQIKHSFYLERGGMKSNQFHEHQHIKRELLSTTTSSHTPSLNINSHSHFIKKLPPPPSSAAVATAAKPRQPCRPVIIYTHSPKVIHTHPRDFMTLVQKLTGLSRPDIDPPPRGDAAATAGSEESDAASVITEEHCSSISSLVGNMQVITSEFMSGPPPSFPVFDLPLFPNDFLSEATTAFYNNYAESAFFMPNNMRSSLIVMKECPDF